MIINGIEHINIGTDKRDYFIPKPTKEYLQWVKDNEMEWNIDNNKI